MSTSSTVRSSPDAGSAAIGTDRSPPAELLTCMPVPVGFFSNQRNGSHPFTSMPGRDSQRLRAIFGRAAKGPTAASYHAHATADASKSGVTWNALRSADWHRGGHRRPFRPPRIVQPSPRRQKVARSYDGSRSGGRECPFLFTFHCFRPAGGSLASVKFSPAARTEWREVRQAGALAAT